MKLTAPVEPVAASTPEAWVDVLAGLVGLPLAVYDELIRGGDLSAEEIAARLADPRIAPGLRTMAMRAGAIENALGWLGAHRLAMCNTAGRWRHVGMVSAQRAFLERGVDRAHTFTLGGSLAAQERSGDRRSQAQVRHAEAAEGVPFANPTPRPPPVPRPTVHTSGLLDLGEY